MQEYLSYPLLFVWSIFEGEIGLSLAGMLCKEGVMDFGVVFAIAWSGAFIGDMSLYTLGYFSKNKAQNILARYSKKTTKLRQWFIRYGGWIVVFERFIYGTHIPSLLMLGVSRYNVRSFLIFEVIGITLWALVFTTFGYYFGEEAITLLVFIQRHILVLLLLIVFLMVVKYSVTKKE